jgi:hypothetical protein
LRGDVDLSAGDWSRPSREIISRRVCAKTGAPIGEKKSDELVYVEALRPRCDEYALQMRLISLAKARGRKISCAWFGVGFGFSLLTRYAD